MNEIFQKARIEAVILFVLGILAVAVIIFGCAILFNFHPCITFLISYALGSLVGLGTAMRLTDIYYDSDLIKRYPESNSNNEIREKYSECLTKKYLRKMRFIK